MNTKIAEGKEEKNSEHMSVLVAGTHVNLFHEDCCTNSDLKLLVQYCIGLRYLR